MRIRHRHRLPHMQAAVRRLHPEEALAGSRM
jgi:hypothetical protein